MKTILAGLLASTAILRMMPDAADGGGGFSAPTDRDRALADAVAKLDDANDDHWLADGRPRMEAVEAIFGDTTPTREEVDKIGRVRLTSGNSAGAPSTDAGTGSELPAPASTEADPNPPAPPADPDVVAAAGDGAPDLPAPTEPVVPTPPAPINSNVAEGSTQFRAPTPGRIVKLFVPISLVDSDEEPKADRRQEKVQRGGFDGDEEAVGIVVKVNGDGTLNVKGFAPNGGADHTFTGVRNKAEVDAMPDGADKNAAITATWDWPPRS